MKNTDLLRTLINDLRAVVPPEHQHELKALEPRTRAQFRGRFISRQS